MWKLFLSYALFVSLASQVSSEVGTVNLIIQHLIGELSLVLKSQELKFIESILFYLTTIKFHCCTCLHEDNNATVIV